VYLLHVWELTIERALEARELLERLVAEGKIRTDGWSTDRADALRDFSGAPQCGALEQPLSVFDGNLKVLALCDALDLARLNRGPLGMGLLT